MKEKILVVDDEIEVCNLLEEFLTKKGYEVIIATSGREAIEKFKIGKPKLILLDIQMPEMNGIEVIKKIREIDKDVAILMATAVMDENIAKEAMELGASDYIVKPFDLDYLEKSLIMKIITIK